MAQARSRRKWVTAEQLLAMPDDGRRRELIEGEVAEMAPAGWQHGRLGARLQRRVGNWAEQHGLGEVATAETGFVLRRDPDTVRAPDMAFVVASRLPAPDLTGFSEVVPDLVAEVVSPGDRVREVMAKVGEWLGAGVRVVWVVWPAERRIAVYRSGSDITLLGDGDTLTCEELLPGFAVAATEMLG